MSYGHVARSKPLRTKHPHSLVYRWFCYRYSDGEQRWRLQYKSYCDLWQGSCVDNQFAWAADHLIPDDRGYDT